MNCFLLRSALLSAGSVCARQSPRRGARDLVHPSKALRTCPGPARLWRKTTAAPKFPPPQFFPRNPPPIAPTAVSLVSAPTTSLPSPPLDADPDAPDHAAVPLPAAVWT